MNWNLMKNKLEPEELIKLKLTARNNEDESSLIGLASGLCFDFNKFDSNIFILGTEEGKINKNRSYPQMQ
jgi:dynein intermediate chain 1